MRRAEAQACQFALAHAAREDGKEAAMTNFLHPWVAELIHGYLKSWDGHLRSWEPLGAGFLQVLRYVLVPPQEGAQQAEGAYEEVRHALGLSDGFVVLRVGDARHAFLAVVPAEVLAQAKVLSTKKLGLKGVLLRVEMTVKLDGGQLPHSLGLSPAAPCYLLMKKVRFFARKIGVIGLCLPLSLPASVQEKLRQAHAAALSSTLGAIRSTDGNGNGNGNSIGNSIGNGEGRGKGNGNGKGECAAGQQTQASIRPGDASLSPGTGARTLPPGGGEGGEGSAAVAVAVARVMELWECLVPAEQLAAMPFPGVAAASDSMEVDSDEFLLEDIAADSPVRETVAEQRAGTQNGEVAPCAGSASSAPAYPPLSMVSSVGTIESGGGSAEAAQSVVLGQQSSDSLELSTSKDGLDAVTPQSFDSLHDSDLSEQELMNARKNRFMVDSSPRAEASATPLLLQLSPIDQGGDSPIFVQRSPGAAFGVANAANSEDVSMELVSDLYADMATQESQQLPGREQSLELSERDDESQPLCDGSLDLGTASEEEEVRATAQAPPRRASRELDSQVLDEASTSFVDDGDLSALMAVSRDTQGPSSLQEIYRRDRSPFGCSRSTPEQRVAHAPSPPRAQVQGFSVAEMTAGIEAARIAARKETSAQLARQVRRLEASEKEQERLRTANEQLEEQVADLKVSIAQQAKELAKTSLLLQELHKRIRLVDGREPDSQTAPAEADGFLRVNRQLPAALLNRKKRKRDEEQEEEEQQIEPEITSPKKAPRTAEAIGSPTAQAHHRARVIAERARLLAAKAGSKSSADAEHRSISTSRSASPSASPSRRGRASGHHAVPASRRPAPSSPSQSRPHVGSLALASEETSPAFQMPVQSGQAARPVASKLPRLPQPSFGNAQPRHAPQKSPRKAVPSADCPRKLAKPVGSSSSLASSKSKRMALFSKKYLVNQ